MQETETFKLPLRFVWGIRAIDNGNHLIPSSKGSLEFDDNFVLATMESQKWMLNFCKQIKLQPFYQANNVGAILPSCFIENLIVDMGKRCVFLSDFPAFYFRKFCWIFFYCRCMDSMTNTSRMPCCEDENFPYRPDVFERCLPEMISSLYRSPRYIFVPGISGPKFQRISASDQLNISQIESQNRSLVRALVIEYESTQPFTTSFPELAKFSNDVGNWFNEMLKNAPSSLQSGWFTSELGFYDLQQTLSMGTLIGAIIAMISSLIALLLFTLDVRVSLYAIVTVIFTILTSVAALVLLQWKLNILESIAVNTAIGLGIDFVLHYALNYQMSELKDRPSATKYALSHMIGPTLMAAITTAIAGVFMVFSSVLAYIQIGIFLLIVMTISWLYATFFFTSILWVFGPEKLTNNQTPNPNDAHLMEQLNNDHQQQQQQQHDSLETKRHLNKTEIDTKT